MPPTTEAPPLRAPQPKKGRGCFFYGCLTSVVLALVFALLAFFGYRAFKGWVLSYTETSPMELPTVEVSDAEFEELQQRMTVFKEALDEGRGGQELVLTEKDINALIAKSPDTEELKDKVYVSIEEDKVKGLVSFPLDETGLGWLEGRYLNGAATFAVSFGNGALVVTADSVEVNGKPLPDQIMAELRKENLAQEVYRDPEMAGAISKFESIKVEDGRVIITAAEAEDADAVENSAP